MEFDQFKVLAKAMKSIYTRDNFLPDAEAIKTWFLCMKDIPYKVAELAVQKWIMTNKFPPTVAELRELSAQISTGEIPDWGEAWEQACRSIRRFGSYRQKDALDSLDPLCRKAVERLGFINLCRSENIAADRANFRMVYETLAKREQIDQQTALPLQEAIKVLRLEQSDGMLRIGSAKDS